VEILLNNNYPIEIIFKYINLRIKQILNTKLAVNSNKKTNPKHITNKKMIKDTLYFHTYRT